VTDLLSHHLAVPVLYSFRRCPYAMRARLAIVASGLQVELREIVLRDKPAHMLEISPKGTVPVLWLRNGEVVDESLDIMRWALQQNDPLYWLQLTEQQEATAFALIRSLDENFKPNLDRYKYPNRYPQPCDPLEHRAACLGVLKQWSELLASKPYLFGDQVKYVDMALLPFVRQFRSTDSDWFDAQTDIEPVQKWLSGFLNHDLFNTVMQRLPPWQPDDAPILFPPVV
jgi:glutathione S-transferase